MEAGIEEVKILQSVTLLLTTNTIVHGETLARVSRLKQLHFSIISQISRHWYYVSVYTLQKTLPQ